MFLTELKPGLVFTETGSYCYRGMADFDADSTEKSRISKVHEINADPEKGMSTQIPKKKPLQNGKKMIVLNDSMLRHQKPDIPSKSGNKVNVKFYPGATTEDITDYLRPAMRKKPDAIIIHTGTNDLTNDVNVMKNVRSITKIIEEMRDGGDIQVDSLREETTILVRKLRTLMKG